MLNQSIIILALLLFSINVFATEAENQPEQPRKSETEQPTKKTEPDNAKSPTRPRKSLAEIIKELATRRTTELELVDFQKIDALNDNDYCFIDSSWLVLGRTEANQTVTLEIVARENPAQEIKRDWLAGEAFMTWSLDALPVKDGAVYLVSINNDPHNLTLHQVATDPRITNDFNEFYEKQCWRQLQIMGTNEKAH